MKKNTMIIIGVAFGLVFLCGCVLLSTYGSFQSSYNNLVTKKFKVEQADSNIDANERALSESIQTTLGMFYNTLDQEYLVQVGVAQARSNYQAAKSSGSNDAIAAATGQLIGSLNVVMENPPQTDFSSIASDAMSEVNEKYNVWRQSILDRNSVVSGDNGYNTYCQKLLMPKIACSLGGFPQSFEPYKDPNASMEDLNPRPVGPAPTLSQ